MISAALTSFLTGITEPIEFSFLFVAPILYGIHAVLAGVAFFITNFFGIKMGGSFSHGLIDYALAFNIGTKPAMILVWGLAYAALYFTVFSLAIRMFNLRTPGREDETDASANADVGSELARNLFVAFGGQSNIASIDACITRLRVTVHDAKIVDTKAIEGLGATAVLVVGNNMQAIFGPRSDQIKTEMNELLKSGRAPVGAKAVMA